jgi:hypothetical protein
MTFRGTLLAQKYFATLTLPRCFPVGMIMASHIISTCTLRNVSGIKGFTLNNSIFAINSYKVYILGIISTNSLSSDKQFVNTYFTDLT